MLRSFVDDYTILELRVKEAIGRSRGNSGGFARAIAEKVSL